MATVDWASSTSTSTFTTAFSTYDVFLNFKGEDTRNHFTAFLNLIMKDKGIDVFLDSEKLWTGEAIGPALLKAIDDSKISIPVFSQGYANSKWCLQELAQILECHNSNGQLVLPIFFHVDPSHVRNQTGSFEEAFIEHEKNFEPHIVESWKKALRVVGNFKGEVIDKTQDQAKIVEAVVKRVLDELVSSTHLDECKFAIGLDSRVKDLLSLLNIGSNDVQFIGICGSSGIGKTTIAEAVYNHILSNFNSHSFMSDVSKQAMQCMGLASLQKRLLKDVFKADFDINHYHRGKKMIKRRLCKEKVLLVLDDVESKEQIDALASEFNWFGQGSRVIVTTRDEHILNVAKIEKEKIYWPQKLDNEESLQLFSLHAFSMDEPPQDFMQLSLDMIRYSRGLPSTLTVLGSYLSEIRSEEEWKITLRKLKTGKASISNLASLRRENQNPSWSTTSDRDELSKFMGEDQNPSGSTTIDGVINNLFTIAEIRAATKSFDESLVIGEGGFGTVYRGVLDDGTVAAFKRLNPQGLQGRTEFLREISLLLKLRHRHVISMIGFCEEKNEMILVYEHMAKGNLMKNLFGSILTWKQRLEICVGAARGLHYLHTDSGRGTIHRDVKSSNILLDENFVAKWSDFGLSIEGPALDHTHLTTPVMGTYGYAAPEYLATGQLNVKSDVYSFGMVLLEVVCARRAVDPKLPKEQVNLREWALNNQRKSLFETIVDPRLQGNYSVESLELFVKIAEKCVDEDRKSRPAMGEVLQDLESVLQMHEAWLIGNAGKESTCLSLVGTVGLKNQNQNQNWKWKRNQNRNPNQI